MPRKKLFFLSFLILVCSFSLFSKTDAWWDVGHRIIASEAIKGLPDGWRSFFQYYEGFINETVVWPDSILKEIDPDEDYRHWYHVEVPVEEHLKDPNEGTLPWAVLNQTRELINAIKARNWYEVLVHAGLVAHYLGDAAQPYHSTRNYNPPVTSIGAVPGVKPKHGLVDSMIQRHIADVEIRSFSPKYVEDVFNYTLLILNQSHSFLYSLNQSLFGEDVYDPADDSEWDGNLRAIIENRTNAAVKAVLDVWYTAIVSANALEAAPNPLNYRKLNVSVDIPEVKLGRGVAVTVKLVDLIGVPVDAEVSVKLNGFELSTIRSELGTYIAVVPGKVISENAGKNLTLTVKASNADYGAVERKVSFYVPPLTTTSSTTPTTTTTATTVATTAATTTVSTTPLITTTTTVQVATTVQTTETFVTSPAGVLRISLMEIVIAVALVVICVSTLFVFYRRGSVASTSDEG